LSTRSVSRHGKSGTTLVCLTCSHDVHFADDLKKENKCIESWNKKSTNKKRILNTNPHLRHLQISNLRKMKTLAILKNGSRLEELKSCLVKDYGKTILEPRSCKYGKYKPMQWTIEVS